MKTFSKGPIHKASTVSQYLRHSPPHIRELMTRLRSIIIETIPDAEETIKFTVPFYSRHGLLCYLSPLKDGDGVYIGFTKGYLMSDEYDLFQGKSLKQIRHMVYRTPSDIKKKILQRYLEEAMMLNEIAKHPFPFK